MCLGSSSAEAASFTLAWDRNPEPDVIGYRVYWGISASALTNQVNVGNSITYFFTEPDPTVRYYFAVLAYNSAGLDSPLSAVISSTPGSQPLSLSRAALSFGATKNGTNGPFIASTPGQAVSVNYTGSTVPVWTATSNASWARVTGGSGSGAGQFTVSVINPGNVGGTHTATITVTAPNIGQTRTLPVSLTIQTSGASGLPVGSFDTPVTSSTVQGSIPVTGWALDDLGMGRVEIWRNPVGAEPGLVFIGTAAFVDGARPDVEAAYAGTPLAYRAGWGYMLLTWGLPSQGNGTFVLHAFAYDNQGQNTLLGSKTIVSTNNQAVRPFGAIDTPGYGATVSGAFWVFGWALTPRPNSTDGRTCTISPTGAQVSVDSGPLQTVNYGAARPDIAASFPGHTNSAAASGSWWLDTTTLSNGVHTIGWLVTDSCGRADGMGSRTFTVLNGGANDAPASTPGDAPAVLTLAAAPERSPLLVRYNNAQPSVSEPSAAGVHVVEVEQTARVEIQLPMQAGRGDYAGAQIVGGERRALPPGSSLDAKSGVFAWQPPMGVLGGFDLAFGTGDGSEVRTRVVVGPPMRAAIDTPQGGQAVQPFLLAGWALDLGATSGSGIDTVHVWAYPTGGGEPTFLGVAVSGNPRPDVASVYGSQFEGSSYDLLVNSLPAGTYDIVVYPHRASTNAFDGAQSVRVSVQ